MLPVKTLLDIQSRHLQRSISYTTKIAKFEKKVNKDSGKALEKAIEIRLHNIAKEEAYDAYDKAYALGDLSDTIQALVKDHRVVGPGSHLVSYWKGDKMIAEFIAHASENYWQGNEEFKKICPELYKEMKELVEKMD